MKLKTLKDLHSKCKWFTDCNQECAEIDLEKLKQEAIKWVMKESMIITADEWNYFFNITEADLK